jgi:hypothetical protein
MRFFMEFSGARDGAQLAYLSEGGRWRRCWGGHGSPDTRLQGQAGERGWRYVGHKNHLIRTPHQREGMLAAMALAGKISA